MGGEDGSGLSYSMIGAGFVCHCCCTVELGWLFLLDVAGLLSLGYDGTRNYFWIVTELVLVMS